MPPALDPAVCKANVDQAAIDCERAIADATDPKVKSILLFRRAYAKNEKQGFEDALPDLNAALQLDPSNTSALHERGYTLSSLGRYAAALADLDAEQKLTPDRAAVYQERAFSRFRVGDLQGTFDDIDRAAALGPANPDALQARARAAMWLGRFDSAASDLNAALAMAKTANNDKLMASVQKDQRILALWTTPSAGPNPADKCRKADKTAGFAQAGVIGDCTLAFLQAKTGAEKADFLTIRAIALRITLQDFRAGLADVQVAAALDPDNPAWHANLGSAFLWDRHSWGALQEFNRSIELKPSWTALSGRAAAKYNLGDDKGAFADAKKSFEIYPNELALTVLGDLAIKDLHDPKSAKLYWMGAYHLGDRDDGLIARLKGVGVDAPDKEPSSDTDKH